MNHFPLQCLYPSTTVLPTPPAGGKGLSVHSLSLFPCTFSSLPWAQMLRQISLQMSESCEEAISVQGGRQYLCQLCTILQLDTARAPRKPVVVGSSREVQTVAEKRDGQAGKTAMAARSGTGLNFQLQLARSLRGRPHSVYQFPHLYGKDSRISLLLKA